MRLDWCAVCGVEAQHHDAIEWESDEGDVLVICRVCSDVMLPGLLDLMLRSCPYCSVSMN